MVDVNSGSDLSEMIEAQALIFWVSFVITVIVAWALGELASKDKPE